jgi:4-amino-4-deoxy-L-arabinose transferase-like glycosyltransferase
VPRAVFPILRSMTHATAPTAATGGDDSILTASRWADSTVPIFWAFVAAHVVGWTVVPALVQRCLPFDTIEMAYWGHEWQWGYYKHPPLPAWMAEGCWLLFGSVDWPLYLTAQLCVAASFWAVWRLAREVLPPWPALVAVALLEACPFLNYATPQWNNNGPTKPLWALAILWLCGALTRRTWWCWPAAGAALGLAMLAKYDVVLLIAAMIGFLVIHPAARWAWRTSGPYVMLAVAGLIIVPHLAWFLAGDAPTIAYIRDKYVHAGGAEARSWARHVIHPLAFVASQIGAVIGMPLLVASVFGRRWRWAEPEGQQRFVRDFLMVMVLGPPALATAASVATGMRMIPLWGTPMWTFFGLLLLLVVDPIGTSLEFRRLFRRCLAVGVVLLACFGIAKTFHGEVTGRARRVQYPGRELAAEVNRRWAKVSDRPLRVVGGDWWLAGVAAWYGPQRLHVYPELQAAWAPWVDDASMRRDGGVLLWEGRMNETVRGWLARFPEARVEPPIELPVPGVMRDLAVRIQMAVVAPAAAE